MINNHEYEIIDYDDDINIIDYINIPSYNMHLIPNNLLVSTMTTEFDVGTIFISHNIYNYMHLEKNNIVAMKCTIGTRYLPGYDHISKSIYKNKKKLFYNQITIIMNISDDKFVNMKLFKDGSVHMTGTKNLIDANIAINKLTKKLKEKIRIKKNDDNNNELKEIFFVADVNKIKITNFKIQLINSNFKINFKINKETLHNLLNKHNILSRLTPKHSCVNIKYKITRDDVSTFVSIFIFQTGNIIITGAKNANDIRDTYIFIVKFLHNNKQSIIKKDITSLITNII